MVGRANVISAELQEMRRPEYAHERAGTKKPASGGLAGGGGDGGGGEVVGAINGLGTVRYAEIRTERERWRLCVRCWAAMELYS